MSIKIIDINSDDDDTTITLDRSQIADLLPQLYASILDGWMTSDQLCEYLQIRRDYLYDLVGHERIPFVRINRLLRFKRSEIDIWIESHRA